MKFFKAKGKVLDAEESQAQDTIETLNQEVKTEAFKKTIVDVEGEDKEVLPEEYEEEYSAKKFWDKLKGYARKAGIEVVNPALQLYYASESKNTPPWAKTVIYGALGYFISFIDAIPDLTPIIGYTDDVAVLAAALAAVAINITPEIKEKAKNKTHDWFGEDESESKEPTEKITKDK